MPCDEREAMFRRGEEEEGKEGGEEIVCEEKIIFHSFRPAITQATKKPIEAMREEVSSMFLFHALITVGMQLE